MGERENTHTRFSLTREGGAPLFATEKTFFRCERARKREMGSMESCSSILFPLEARARTRVRERKREME